MICENKGDDLPCLERADGHNRSVRWKGTVDGRDRKGETKSHSVWTEMKREKKEVGFLSDRLQQSIALLQLRELWQFAEARYLLNADAAMQMAEPTHRYK